ncbi:MAG: Uncharacterised protein [Synechococcus sp. CC9902]|nr:MAG: Uncharacterised protein [Synechococcus sp. CC9902]
MGCCQGLNSVLKALFLRFQCLALIAESLQRELPFTLGIQQFISLAARFFKALVGGFQVLLQLFPDSRVVLASAALLCGFQPMQFLLQRSQFQPDRIEALPLGCLILLQSIQPFSPLATALQQWSMVSPRCVAFGHQGSLFLLQFAQLRFQLLQALAEFGLLTSAGRQGLAQLQQPAAQWFGLILLIGTAEAEPTAALGEAAACHGTALFEQFPLQCHGP